MNEKMEMLLYFFEKNKNEWINRNKLKILIGISDSDLRSYISVLRYKGYTIIGKSKKGYKLSDDQNEIIEYANKEVQKHINSLNCYRKWIKLNKIENNLRLNLNND